jgi:phage terminase large subunit-like protein
LKASSRDKHDTSPTNPVTRYARAVVDGVIVAGHAVRQACARHLRDLQDGPARGLRFSRQAVERVLRFFSALRLAEGVHAGEPFTLQPWQVFVVGSLFGWLGPDGYRRFRSAYLEAGKGSGKTPMSAAVALFGLVADREEGAQVLIGATTREQANICFDDARKMVNASPMLSRLIGPSVTTLSVPSTNSFLRAVSAEGRTLDGHRGHIIVVDELHEHPNDLVLAKLRASVKGRRQPLVLSITNAGHDRTSVCWQQHAYGLQVLDGVAPNDSHFVYICQLDACPACRATGHVAPVEGCARCDSWKDESVWIKTNPSLPITPTLDYLREQVREAVGMPGKESLVRRLNFCEWLESHSRWLDMEAWHACAGEVADAELAGQPCYGGLDLGQSDDFSAFVRLWTLEDGRMGVRCRFWLPRSALTVFSSRPYDVWRRSGHLIVTQGDVTDYDQVEAEIIELCRESGVREIAYDKRFASQMALHLEGAGLTVVDTPQGFSLNEALGRLSDLVKSQKLLHGGHPILGWMAGHALVRHGMRGEIRLDKDKAGDKIDGIAALAMALSRAMVQTSPVSIYESRGVLALG